MVSLTRLMLDRDEISQRIQTMIDLEKRMIEFRRATEVQTTTENEYIVNPGEIPWQEMEDSLEKNRARSRQRHRMFRKIHPGRNAETIRKHNEKYPGRNALRIRIYCKENPERAAESKRRFFENHPGYNAEALRKFFKKRVWATKELRGSKLMYLSAPYKRIVTDSCEICGDPIKEGLYNGRGWHHWTDLNPSMGVWVCCITCNIFAEAIDLMSNNVQYYASSYFNLKRQLDEMYADGEIVRLAEVARRFSRIGTTVGGVYGLYPAWGKRSKPEDSLCEVCHIHNCSQYHHWDDTILGKGMWLCMHCHGFAEVLDACGVGVIDKYLLLKVQDELRVLALMRQDNIIVTSDMFSCLEMEVILNE